MQPSSPAQADAESSPTALEAPTEDNWGYGGQLWLRLQRELHWRTPDAQTPIRLASHVALLLVMVGLLVLSQVKLPNWEIKHGPLLPAPPITPTPQALSELVAATGGSAVQPSGELTRLAVPFTIIPDRPRLDIETYVVQPGDTVFGIAEKFHSAARNDYVGQ